MIRWPVVRAWADACWDGDESQQPMWPHVTQRRRWNHQPSAARHSTQPVPLGGTDGSICSVMRPAYGFAASIVDGRDG